MELDPILKKGIRLLHSRSKDSADQLKALLEDVIRQRQEKSLSSAKEHFQMRRDSPAPRARQGSPLTVAMKNDTKRELPAKFKDEDHPSKRQKLDSPHSAFKSHTPSPTPSVKSENSSRSRKSEDSGSDTDMNDLANEIGITCSVCKSFEVTSGNTLVECQECHTLYHQECHKPTVSHQDVTDPRLVWYCAKCSRSLKKQSSLVAAATTNPPLNPRGTTSSSGSKNGNSNASSRVTSSPSKPHSGLQRSTPFTNLVTAGRTIGTSSSGGSYSSSSSGGGSNNGKNLPPLSSSRTSNPILSAERRVNLMKKKAAAKNAERRKI